MVEKLGLIAMVVAGLLMSVVFYPAVNDLVGDLVDDGESGFLRVVPFLMIFIIVVIPAFFLFRNESGG